MRERPILFSGAMVRAILEGRKTQTRRVVKPYPGHELVELREAEGDDGSRYSGRHDDPMSWGYQFLDDGAPALLGQWPELCPYGQPGDRLWVKETWRTAKSLDAKSPTVIGDMCLDAGYRRPWAPLAYEADGHRNSEWRGFETGGDAEPGKTRVSIHMPRWACRLALEITDVRVERLQAISEADAEAEGAIAWAMESPERVGAGPRAAFRGLWTSINGQASWDANPWVWAITLKRIGS